MCIRILLSIEYNIYRCSLKKILETYDDICITGETNYFDDVERMISDTDCDIIITDMHIKNRMFADVLDRILMNEESIGIIAMISSNNIDIKNIMGKCSIISLSSDIERLVKIIHIVNNKEKYIDECIRQKNNIYFNEKIGLLTNREVEVLKLIAQGYFNKEIASKMGITERTVKNHVSNLFKKLDVCDRTQAAIYAIKNNIINL